MDWFVWIVWIITWQSNCEM
uniref:Uncharacterized protein n=1 Tax=Wuchereria bancrofti TaxID=6293 RepID=A0AAF5Q0R9_WUCBA